MVGAGGGRCFAILLVDGRFLFPRTVGGRCLNEFLVGGRWFMVGGRWSVVCGWSVVGGFVLRCSPCYPFSTKEVSFFVFELFQKYSASKDYFGP